MDRTFRYRPRLMRLILAVAFFGVCGAVLRHEALTNQRRLLIEGLIELSPHQATQFYRALAAASLLFVVAGVFFGVAGLLNPRNVVLGHDGVQVPRTPLSVHTKLIRYGDIRRLFTTTVHRQHFLTIVHADGKASLILRHFESDAVFEEFREELIRRAGVANT